MSIKQVTSPQNQSIKLLRSLDMRKVRTETGLFIGEGVKISLMAKEQGWTPEMVLFETGDRSKLLDEIVEWGLSSNAECLEVSPDILSKLSTKDNPQSVVTVFKQRWSTPQEMGSSLWVALEEIRDPGNLGTIIRTADATQTNGIFLIGNCCDPYSREAVRASMGSIFSVPLIKTSIENFLTSIRDWKGEIVGTHLKGSVDFRRDYEAPTLLIMGSEGPGMSDALAGHCTLLTKIPMGGHADSLNLAMATGLMLYEIRRTNKAS